MLFGTTCIPPKPSGAGALELVTPWLAHHSSYVVSSTTLPSGSCT